MKYPKDPEAGLSDEDILEKCFSQAIKDLRIWRKTMFISQKERVADMLLYCLKSGLVVENHGHSTLYKEEGANGFLRITADKPA